LFFGVYLVFAACLLLFDLLGALTVFGCYLSTCKPGVTCPDNDLSPAAISELFHQRYAGAEDIRLCPGAKKIFL
jgi:hypothetical protein